MKYFLNLLIFVFLILENSIAQKWSASQPDSSGIIVITNKGGQLLGYSTSSGMKILTADGFAFKDLNKNGRLDKYEDWRLSVDVRVKDIASQLSIEQIAGLMLYSKHQAIPAFPGGPFAGTYDGKPFAQSGANPYDLSDQQKKFLLDDNVRHVLIIFIQPGY